MQFERKWTVFLSGLAFVALFWGGSRFFFYPEGLTREAPVITLFFIWGLALSILLHTFWIVCLSKQGLTGMGRVLLRLHGVYILPCVVTEVITVLLSLKLGVRDGPTMLGIILSVGGIFIALSLYDLKKGKLASRLTNIWPALKYSLLLPAGLATWFFCFQVFISTYNV